MTHLCCRACRMRFAPSATPDPTCPGCGEPLSSLAPPEAMGYRLSAPAGPLWRPADLDALARAVANAGANFWH
jgi:predicted amidophosphoribosyltransferase